MRDGGGDLLGNFEPAEKEVASSAVSTGMQVAVAAVVVLGLAGTESLVVAVVVFVAEQQLLFAT